MNNRVKGLFVFFVLMITSLLVFHRSLLQNGLIISEAHVTSALDTPETAEQASQIAEDADLNALPLGNVEEELAIAELFRWIAFQTETDESLLQELSSGLYSFENPLVILDPYDMAPLTALILFTSEEPLKISISIPDSDNSQINFSFSDWRTEHFIPVYGLFPDESNEVVLSCQKINGEKLENRLSIATEKLPDDIVENVIIPYETGKGKMQPGFTFIYAFGKNSDRKVGFDALGNVRWYLSKKINPICAYDNGNRFFFSLGAYFKKGNTVIFETNILGKIVNVYYSEYGVHHDIALTTHNTMNYHWK